MASGNIVKMSKRITLVGKLNHDLPVEAGGDSVQKRTHCSDGAPTPAKQATAVLLAHMQEKDIDFFCFDAVDLYLFRFIHEGTHKK